MRYRDRQDAGAALAQHLGRYAGRDDVTVLGLVRGGVPVAAEVARRLDAPLDALVVRKLGVPWAPEVAFGALGPDGTWVLNDEIAGRLPTHVIDTVMRDEAAALIRGERRYRNGRPGLDLADRIAVIVDDGLATGATARAAVVACGRLGAGRTVVAAPVASRPAAASVAAVADEVVCPEVPVSFGAVSRFYRSFRQVTDDEVVACLTGGGR